MGITTRCFRVVSIECEDYGSVGGILASSPTIDLKTDSSWECSRTGLDDWAPAYEIGSNDAMGWGLRPGIAGEANWIWTAAGTWQGEHLNVTCRKFIV